MPLPPMFAFKDSPSSLRLLEIPKKIGQWSITTVKVAVNYPDNTTHIYDATRIGNVWVVTFNGCSITGKVMNGLEILADGIDENGDAVNGYVLGVGDIYILDRDADIEEAVSKHTMRYCEVMPETPVAGDVFIGAGAVEIYDGTQWISIDIDLSEYATKSELETSASTLDSKIDSTKTELEGSIAEVASDIPTTTSELTNDSGFITSASVPTKTSDLTNDSDFTTNTALNTGLALKQDKLSVPQINSINSDVDDNKTVVYYDNIEPRSYDIYGTMNIDDIRVEGSNITGVKIGRGVKTLGMELFMNTPLMTSIELPDSLKTIGTNAFTTSHVTSLVIPDSVETINAYAFTSITYINSITIGSGVETIEQGAFDASNIGEVIFRGKTLAEVQAMSNYPWGITDTSIIKTWNATSKE